MDKTDNNREDRFKYLTIELKTGKISEDLKRLEKILDFPIVKQEVWVGYKDEMYSCGQRKYGDYYPGFGLLITTFEKQKRGPFFELESYSDSAKEKPEEKTESSHSFFDDLDYDISQAVADDIATMTYADNKIVDDFVRANLPDYVRFASPVFNEKLFEHLFKVITSAKFHVRRTALYAKFVSDKFEKGYPSHLRQDEVFKLWDADLPNPNMENFAVLMPTGERMSCLVYFHMDDSTFKTHNLRQINKYLYNDETRGLLPYYNLTDEGVDFTTALKEFPVLVFGYNEFIMPDGVRYPLCDFLGEYNHGETDDKGNIKLRICDYRFDLIN